MTGCSPAVQGRLRLQYREEGTIAIHRRHGWLDRGELKRAVSDPDLLGGAWRAQAGAGAGAGAGVGPIAGRGHAAKQKADEQPCSLFGPPIPCWYTSMYLLLVVVLVLGRYPCTV